MNEPFNPHLHQAVMEIPRTDVPAGTIVQVFQPGFMIEDRVLRPAMVAAAKGGTNHRPLRTARARPRHLPTRTHPRASRTHANLGSGSLCLVTRANSALTRNDAAMLHSAMIT